MISFALSKTFQITVGGEEKHSKYDPLFLWEDHEACWKMQFRGSLGIASKSNNSSEMRSYI